MTETDLANSWSVWLAAQLERLSWRQADLVKNSGGLIKRDRASKWSNGNERPSYRLAIVAANTLGAPIAEALAAAGYETDVLEEQRRRDDAADRAYLESQKIRFPERSAAVATPDLSTFSTQELLAEIAKRVQDDANVPAPSETQKEYARVARKRSKDRGEDLQ